MYYQGFHLKQAPLSTFSKDYLLLTKSVGTVIPLKYISKSLNCLWTLRISVEL